MTKKDSIESVTDEAIVELYWQRDERAIVETDRKYGAYLYAVANNLLHDPQDSEECRNDTYLGVWNAIPPTRPQSLVAFLVKLIRRIAINRYKERTRDKRIPPDELIPIEELSDTLVGADSVTEAYAATELSAAISSFVRKLSHRRRYIFIGRFYLGEPVERLAADLAVTSSAIYKEISHLRADLRVYLERKGYML